MWQKAAAPSQSFYQEDKQQSTKLLSYEIWQVCLLHLLSAHDIFSLWSFRLLLHHKVRNICVFTNDIIFLLFCLKNLSPNYILAYLIHQHYHF
jgi:hypothetical protein